MVSDIHDVIDFSRQDLAYRRQHGGGRKQDIAKAIGLKHNWCPHVLDSTAGLGRDAYIMASLGCSVSLVERNAKVAKALGEALVKAQSDPENADIAKRMKVYHMDAKDWLNTNPSPDVVYIDPMFPKRQKSALVKQEMRTLRQIVGDDEDAESLLEVALEKAIYRVVVKRPRISEKISGQKPSFILEGKANRLDVYVKKAIPGT